MTQDFVRHKSAAKKSQHHTSNKRTINKKTHKPIPVWVWLLMGVFLGALLMLLFYAIVMQPQQATIGHAKPQTNETKRPQPRFDFYQLLKDQEVAIPDTMPELTDMPAENTVYLLQVGSFRNNVDADRLRAQLLLLNLAVTVEKAKAYNGESWYRVIVGPFKSRSNLAKARSILAANQIDSLLLKQQ
jgi:cell division protein FtsN